MSESESASRAAACQPGDSEDSIPGHRLRQAAGRFATGVTIVTTLSDGQPRGMTANSFASVSLDPPLVLWNVGKASDSYRAFSSCQAFAVHILSAEQKHLAKLFATRGADRFADVTVSSGLAGTPLLAGCLAVFECRVAHRHPGGDHTIIVGEVVRLHEQSTGEPLIFYKGEFITPGKAEIDIKIPSRAG